MNAVTEITAQTATHSGIYAALAKAQLEMGKALKDATNPHFNRKYADLSSVVNACLAALNQNGICVFQPTVEEGGKQYVETVLGHVSGQTISCRVPLLLGKNDMQGYGSAVTYARRYGLMSMTGVAPQDDDDGNAAAASAPKGQTQDPAPKAATDPAPEAIDYITAALDLADLQRVWGNIPPQTQKIASVIAAKDKRKAALINPPIEADSIPY